MPDIRLAWCARPLSVRIKHMLAVFDLHDVAFGYGGKQVLKNINLHLHAGQFAAIVGPSGAGKSTLLKLVLGTLKPTHGKVEICAEALGDQCKRAVRIGYIPQLETVDWNFPVTVAQAVLMGRHGSAGHRSWLPWHSADDKLALKQVLAKLEIDMLADRHIRDLSGGQQQRVFLARALIAEPDILVLDEPTSGVDPRTAQNVMHQLAHLNHDGMTILMTTHDLNLAAAHVPWIIALNGCVVAEGTPEDVFTEAVLNDTYNADMLVIRHGGGLFVQERPHGHSWRDVVPEPVLGHSVVSKDV